MEFWCLRFDSSIFFVLRVCERPVRGAGARWRLDWRAADSAPLLPSARLPLFTSDPQVTFSLVTPYILITEIQISASAVRKFLVKTPWSANRLANSLDFYGCLWSVVSFLLLFCEIVFWHGEKKALINIQMRDFYVRLVDY